MSKRQKLIQKWRDDPPPEESFDKIKSVLEYYDFEIRKGKHWVASHDKLKELPDFQAGEIVIPTKHGRMVKRFYIKRIVVALELIGAFDDSEE
jgi:hypothetical protein